MSSSASGGTTLSYDPLGRLWKIWSQQTGTTSFVYEGDHVSAEYDWAGNMLRRYFWGPGADEPIIQDEGGALNCTGTRFLHANHQGSIIATSNCNGNLTAINRYDEYGIPQGNWGRFQYTGQAWLPELGMYYYKARLYSATLGRFLQTDPIGYDDQVNLYAYVGNDPVNKNDPSGLCAGPLVIPCGIIAVEAVPGAMTAATATATLIGGAIITWITSNDNDKAGLPVGDQTTGNATGGPPDPDRKDAPPGPLKQSSQIGDRVRTPDNSRESFTRLKNGQGFKDNDTKTVMQKSNTNHSQSPNGEWKAGIKPGQSPTPNAKVTISGGRVGGCIIKKDGC